MHWIQVWLRAGATRRAPFRITAAMAFLLGLGPAVSAPAQPIEPASGAQSLLVDPSVRAGGMGRASSAVFWGSQVNPWSNPALVAYQSGIRYEWGKTQLVPDLASDVFFTSKRVEIGYWGLGLLASGRPFERIGGSKLDYGLSTATDVDGNVIGTFRSYEEVRTFAAAVNALQFSENLLRAGGVPMPSLSRFGDVAIGWTENKTHILLAPASLTQDLTGAEGDVTTHDSGILFRVTPYDAIDEAGLVPALDRAVPIRIDISHGRSTQNYGDARIVLEGIAQSDPVLRTHRTGWAARVALGLGPAARDGLKSQRVGWLADVVTPLLAWGKAWDAELPMILDPVTRSHRLGTRVMEQGWELTIANIYTIRRGQIDDPAGKVIGPTSGWGIGLHFKDLAGFSYDRATVPQSIYLEHVHRKSFTFYVNPIKAWSTLRSRRTASPTDHA